MGNYSSFKLSKLHVGGVSSREHHGTFDTEQRGGGPIDISPIRNGRKPTRCVCHHREKVKTSTCRSYHPTAALGGAGEPTIAESPTADDKDGAELVDLSPHASPMSFNRVLSAQPTQVTDDSCFACTDATSSIDNTMVADRRSYTPLLSAPASEG